MITVITPEYQLIDAANQVRRDVTEINGLIMQTIGDRAQLERLDKARDQAMAGLNVAVKRLEKMNEAKSKAAAAK